MSGGGGAGTAGGVTGGSGCGATGDDDVSASIALSWPVEDVPMAVISDPLSLDVVGEFSSESSSVDGSGLSPDASVERDPVDVARDPFELRDLEEPFASGDFKSAEFDSAVGSRVPPVFSSVPETVDGVVDVGVVRIVPGATISVGDFDECDVERRGLAVVEGGVRLDGGDPITTGTFEVWDNDLDPDSPRRGGGGRGC